ncbi:MAG: glutamate racemase [Lachnospiraceae bacterium]|nr:glutamate racemase [Lachnospiraceae bacterium]
MSSQAPIGVFDSGIGGITVVKELISRLPNEKIIYYGDTARVPYGNKSANTIVTYSRQIAHFLIDQGVKAIVIACNTASAIALEVLRRELPVPVIGVVVPGARAAAQASKNKKIGVIATRATINSCIYEAYLQKTNPDTEVYKQACPLFVPLVEEGWIHDDITKQIIHRYIDGLLAKGIDSLVLGCTHYPLLAETIAEVVGKGITLVNPAYECAKDFKLVLEENELLNDVSSQPVHEFFVSDGPVPFAKFANSILGEGTILPENVLIKCFE